jgi:hypothetical protein
MNEYMTTFLAEDHRRELLAEARDEALARQFREGREPWWRRLSRRSADTPVDRPTSLKGHMAAPVVSSR